MARWSKKRQAFTIVGVLIVVVLIYQWRTGAPVTGPVANVGAGGGAYSALTPAQHRLVDDWVERFGKATSAAVTSAQLYDGLTISTRTTFDAVTHALSHTPLTDMDGTPLKLTALDLVAKVDAVAGSVPDAGGDKQFRMYVQLRPDARQILEKSREFSRQVDNTVYHKGYPICFRGAGGTPSIQFSLAPDGTRGDIDVDYRASDFPIMLINGHLTASNSDVRAGNNDERHNGIWTGLANWWRAFMGLVVGELPPADAATAAAALKNVASEPRMGKGTKPEDAIADFLNAWLVEGNPGVAAGYVAPRAFACLETERGVPVDRGVARYQIVAAMQAANQKIGRVSRLSEAIQGVSLTGPRGKPMAQANQDAFVMYDVRDDLASAFDCENRLRPGEADPKKVLSTAFGTYVGAVFRVKTPTFSGDTVATLWTQENGAWRLVSYAAEPELALGALPGGPVAPATPALPVIDGNPDMIRAAGDFFDAWFVRKDYAAAFRHLSPASYSCYNVFRSPDAPPAATRAEGGTMTLEPMRRLAEWAGTSTRLEDLVAGVEPHHPDLKLVKHDASAAFVVAAIPDVMGIAAECHRLKPGIAPRVEQEGPKEYGTFYAASIRFKRAGQDGAVLWTVWARQGQAWKVVSYLVITP